MKTGGKYLITQYCPVLPLLGVLPRPGFSHLGFPGRSLLCQPWEKLIKSGITAVTITVILFSKSSHSQIWGPMPMVTGAHSSSQELTLFHGLPRFHRWSALPIHNCKSLSKTMCSVFSYVLTPFTIRNSSANSVNQTLDVSRWISWWRNGKPCQHHNKFKWQKIMAIICHIKLYRIEDTIAICSGIN